MKLQRVSCAKGRDSAALWRGVSFSGVAGGTRLKSQLHREASWDCGYTVYCIQLMLSLMWNKSCSQTLQKHLEKLSNLQKCCKNKKWIQRTPTYSLPRFIYFEYHICALSLYLSIYTYIYTHTYIHLHTYDCFLRSFSLVCISYIRRVQL